MAFGTYALYQNLRTRLLTYTGSSGQSIGTILSGQLYIGSAPDGAEYPYGVMAIVNAGTHGTTNGAKVTGAMEVTFVAFPFNRGGQRSVELLGDLADQAMLRYKSYVDSGVGLVFSRERLTRDTLPVSSTNAAAVRCIYRIDWWPDHFYVTSGNFS